ncbi:MAG: NAD-dependent DNA ligase LigA, partial [Clostridia bacterium]|nr:NAD-dependent DNA ligase LigA [Clostridia bacterium]
MTAEQAKIEIEQLTSQLNEHIRRYYVEDAPTISDYDYDMMMRRLADLERQFPMWLSPISPTQRVGGVATDGFEPFRHAVPLLSLQDAFSYEELAVFDER